MAPGASHSKQEEAKSEWPELVGVDGEQAAESIRAERPELRVLVLPSDATVTCDFRTDRVRVFVNKEDGKVARAPRVG